MKYAFMALFIIAFVRSPKHLVLFIAAFMMACFKMGQEGLWGQISGGLVWQSQGIMRLHGSTPMYLHPNTLSGMALGTLPFIYYLYSISKAWVKVVLVIMLIFAINIIIFTGSRAGYLAFITFISYLFIRSKFKIKYVVCALIIVMISIPMIPMDYVERFHSIFTGREIEGASYQARMEILMDAWKIFLDHPLGVGVAAFPAVRRATFGREQDTHNLYFEVATNLGIQGLVVFLLYIFNMMKILRTIYRSADNQIMELELLSIKEEVINNINNKIQDHINDLKLIHAVSSAVFMFVIIRLALGFFGMDLYEIYWWFALGLTISLYNINYYAQKISLRFIKSDLTE